MIYQATITTPANTAINDAVKTVLPVNNGLVYKVEFLFPAGSTGLVYCNIFDKGYQAWPTTPFEWFRGDGDLISFDDTYLKQSPPYEFNIYTYNLDDTYEHMIIVRIGLVTEKAFMARFLPSLTWEFYQEMLQELANVQNAEQATQINQPFSWLK